MTERPLPMRPHEVKAVLRGEQTQFRRICKHQPEHVWGYGVHQSDKVFRAHVRFPGESQPDPYIKCPYGKPGDQLWVKETWCRRFEEPNGFVYNPDGYLDPSCCHYAADGYEVKCVDGDGFTEYRKDGRMKSPWTPSIHMPRWASRIQLEITNVRVERLNAISEDDCEAEGYEFIPWGEQPEPDAHGWYRDLWESIHGKGSWQLNPWVWVVEVKQVNGGAK